MNTKKNPKVNARLFYPFVFFLLVSLNAHAQAERAVDGEKALCKVTIDNKERIVKSSQIGRFDRIEGVRPLTTIPVEVYYPGGSISEKVILSVEDGGKLDNGKKVKVIELNNEKKAVFSFVISDQTGLFRITMRKGTDTKVVQFWAEESSQTSEN